MGRSDSGGGCRSPARHGRGWRREHDPNAASVSRRRRARRYLWRWLQTSQVLPGPTHDRVRVSVVDVVADSRCRDRDNKDLRARGAQLLDHSAVRHVHATAPGLWRADFHTVPLLQVARTRAARRRRERLHLAGVLDTSVAATAPSGKRSCGRLFCLSSKAVVCPRVLAVFSPSVCATLSTRCARSVL